MNSMQQLNGFGSLPVEYTDDRGFLFTMTTPATQTVYVPNFVDADTPQTFISYPGAEVTVARQVPFTGYYQLDCRWTLAANQYPTVTWDNLPADFTYSVVQPGVFRVTGPMLISRWDAIKNPKVTYPATFHGNNAFIAHVVNPTGQLPILPPSAVSWQQEVRWRYQLPYTVLYTEDTQTSLYSQGIFSIQDPDEAGKTYTYSLIQNPIIGNLQLGNTNYGGNITFTANSQIDINTALTSLNFLGDLDQVSNTNLFMSLTRSDSTVLANAVPVALNSAGDLYDPVITRNFTEMHVQGGNGYRFNAAGISSPDNIANVTISDGSGFVNWTTAIEGNNGLVTLDGNNTTMDGGSGPYTLTVTANTARPQSQTEIYGNVYLAYEMIGSAVAKGKSSGNLTQNGSPGAIQLINRFPAGALEYTNYWVQNMHYRVEYRRSNPALHGTVGQTLLEIVRLNQWRVAATTDPHEAQFNGQPLASGYHASGDGGGYNVANTPSTVARAYFKTGHATDYPINVNHPSYNFNSVLNINAGWTAVSTSNGQSNSPGSDTQFGDPVQFSPFDISSLMPVTAANAANGVFDFTVSYIWKKAIPAPSVPNVIINLVKDQVGTYESGGDVFWIAATNNDSPSY